MIVLKTAAALLLLLNAEATTLNGRTTSGELKSLDASQVVLLDKEGKSVNLPVADILTLKIADERKTTDKDPLRVVLNNGSSVPATQVTASAEQLQVESAILGDIQIDRNNVRAVLLQPMKPDRSPQWDAFLARKNETDMLIIEKRDGTGLDFLDGVVSSISAADVPFLNNGVEVAAPRKVVFGVLFARSKEERKSQGGLRIQLVNGSFLAGNSVSLEAANLELQTTWGQSLSIPVDSVAGIDFSYGRLHYLSDLEPISEKYFGLDPPGKEWGPLFEEDRSTRTGLSSQWRMSRNRFPNSGRPPLTLRGQMYPKGVCIFPKAQIDYALDGRYSSLKAIVGVDDDVAFNQQKGRPQTVVELRVEADGEQVTKRLIKALDDPFPLNIDLRGINTLSVIVDFGDDSSMCDYLDLADAKLIVDTSQE